MLGLADQIGGNPAGVRVLIGDDGDFRGAGDRVDADDAGHHALGSGDEDVTRAGDLVDRFAQDLAVLRFGAFGAIGEHGDGLGAADRVHLVNAEDGAGGEDCLVGQTVGGRLARRGGDGERFDAGRLGGHHVHDDRAWVHGLATGHVQADTLDGDPTLRDTGAGRQISVEVLRHLGCGHGAAAADGLFDGGAHFGIKLVKRLLHRFSGYAQVFRTHVVEFLLEVTQGRSTAVTDIVEDRTHQIGGFLRAHLGTWHRRQHLGTGEALSAQVNDSHRIVTHNPTW